MTERKMWMIIGIGAVMVIIGTAAACALHQPKYAPGIVAQQVEFESEQEASALESEKAEEVARTESKAFWAEPKIASTITIEVPTEESSAPITETEPSETLAVTDEFSEISPTSTTVEEIPTEAPTEPSRAVLALSDEDEQLLLRLASCEAGNQGVIGIALVMRVVLNRSAAYGMSIHDVVYAPRQFSVIGNDYWNSGYIAPEAYAALDDVKRGWDASQGALYFCAPWANAWHREAKQYLFTYGGHEFYK